MNKTTIKIYKVFFMKYTNYINDTFCLFLCLKKDIYIYIYIYIHNIYMKIVSGLDFK
ncbi:hypothetical protein PFAG_03313 [Plasmodium falciparum Santa Lucia]|uniref:Uncharacterized protein n=1 Tax=Plasmodium falciparum Santa Lucia TaxID=478859 RepID=W7FHG5_PLAFA|nr:hypothetical protein PFAG_03313 [Plasmodium falciparum Santa Lucia]